MFPATNPSPGPICVGGMNGILTQIAFNTPHRVGRVGMQLKSYCSACGKKIFLYCIIFFKISGSNQVPSRGLVAIHGTGHQISRMWNPRKIARQPEIGWRPQEGPYLQLLEIFQLFNKRYDKDIFLIKGFLNII